MVKISEKGAIFTIIWNLFYTIALFSTIVLGMNTTYTECTVVASVTILYPVVGVIIDVRIGTFKMIKLSLYFLLAAIVLKCKYLFIFHLNIILYLSIVGWCLAGACYFGLIIPLTTTQLIGPSGEELSLTIYWLLWGLSMGQLLSKGLPCLVDLNENQISVFLSMLSVNFLS